MALTIEALQQQKQQTETELEHAKAAVYRCDGALQLLNHLIADAETPETPALAETPAP